MKCVSVTGYPAGKHAAYTVNLYEAVLRKADGVWTWRCVNRSSPTWSRSAHGHSSVILDKAQEVAERNRCKVDLMVRHGIIAFPTVLEARHIGPKPIDPITELAMLR